MKSMGVLRLKQTDTGEVKDMFSRKVTNTDLKSATNAHTFKLDFLENTSNCSAAYNTLNLC